MLGITLDNSILPNGGDVTQREQFYTGTIALSGNYGGGATHGDTLNLAIPGVSSNSVPTRVEIYEQPSAGTAPSFYTGVYQKGTTIANGAVNFSLAGVEYAEGTAYAGALAAAVWKFRAWFPLGR